MTTWKEVVAMTLGDEPPEHLRHDEQYADQTDAYGTGVQAKLSPDGSEVKISLDSYSPFCDNIYLTPNQVFRWMTDKLMPLALQAMRQTEEDLQHDACPNPADHIQEKRERGQYP
jgi:hypothetical protein